MAGLTMQELRNEIRRLQRDYKSLRYPGDLSLDVPQEAPLRMGDRFRPLLAVAAATVLAATAWVLLPDTKSTPVVVVESDTPASHVAPVDIARAETEPAETQPALAIETVTPRDEPAVVVIQRTAPVLDVAVHADPAPTPFHGRVESPFAVQLPTAQMPTHAYAPVSVPNWDNVPSSLSTEWIAMPRQTLTVPNVSEIDATLVSTEPAS